MARSYTEVTEIACAPLESCRDGMKARNLSAVFTAIALRDLCRLSKPPSERKPRSAPRLRATKADAVPDNAQARFGRNLKAARLAAGMTQQEIAASAGVKHTYVSKVENCEANLTFDVAERLAAAIGSDVATLIRES